MYGIAEGIGFLVSGGLPISVQTPGIGEIGNGNLAYYIPSVGLSFLHLPTPLPAGVRPRDVIDLLPYPLLIGIVLVLIGHWVLSRTRFGQHTYAIGGNRLAARRAGIPVVRQTILIYMVSSLMAALAGLLYVFSFTNGAANAGDASLLPSIAAVVIGGASLFGGEGSMLGTLVGALITAVIQNGLGIMGVNGYWQFIAVGIVIILAVLVDQAKTRVEE
jgi:ribose transport system permease protein